MYILSSFGFGINMNVHFYQWKDVFQFNHLKGQNKFEKFTSFSKPANNFTFVHSNFDKKKKTTKKEIPIFELDTRIF